MISGPLDETLKCNGSGFTSDPSIERECARQYSIRINGDGDYG